VSKRHRPFRRELLKRRIKRGVLDVALVAVAVPVVVFAARTLDRPHASGGAAAVLAATVQPPATHSSARSDVPRVRVATVSAAGRLAVRYTGDPGCDAKVARVERSRDAGRTWRPIRTRVTHPTAVSVVGRYVLITGRDADCGWLTEYSYDNAATFVTAPAVLDSSSVTIGAHSWAIGTQGQLLRGSDALFQVDRQPSPCPTRMGAAYVSASGTTVWVVCRGGSSVGQETRLVRVSYDEGLTWADLAGAATPQTARKDGLDGVGRIDGFGFVDATHGWAMLRGTGRCAGNDTDLRVTGDGGRNWTAMPCVPARLAPLVQSVSFADPLRALLLASTPAGALSTVATTDGGATWSVASR
jgi:hypothetical protein